VRNGLFQKAKVERNILQTVNRRQANWIGHILRKKCLLKRVIEGQREGRVENGEEDILKLMDDN
jgi:hypothetical protein